MEQKGQSNISAFLRPGKDIVIELDDEVEYILNESAVNAVGNGQEQILLIRIIDREPRTISARRIKWAISNSGVVDYLDIK